MKHDCQETELLISGYLDGELTQSDRQRVDLILEDCRQCNETHQEMKKFREGVGDIPFDKLTKKEKFFLKKYKPWGVILFTRNIKNIKQAFKLTSSIRKIFNDKNYPILIDQEGGRINRLNNIISFDNFTSEFFGRKYTKKYKRDNLYYL